MQEEKTKKIIQLEGKEAVDFAKEKIGEWKGEKPEIKKGTPLQGKIFLLNKGSELINFVINNFDVDPMDLIGALEVMKNDIHQAIRKTAFVADMARKTSEGKINEKPEGKKE